MGIAREEVVGTREDTRPLIAFVDRVNTASGTELQQRSSAPHLVALAHMTLDSLGLAPRYQNNGPGYYEHARAAARQHPGGMPGTTEGFMRSLLQNSVHLDVYSRYDGPVNKAAIDRLRDYSGFTHNYRRPRPPHLVKGVGSIGIDRAVWLEVEGGVPEAGLETDGSLAFLVLGANDEKIKVHTPGNVDVPAAEGLYFRPESLLVPRSTLVVATRPVHEAIHMPLA